MGRPIRDLGGQVFGLLSALNQHGTVLGHATWACACRCGKTCVVSGTDLVRGRRKSCGCVLLERCTELDAALVSSVSSVVCDGSTSLIARKHGVEYEVLVDASDAAILERYSRVTINARGYPQVCIGKRPTRRHRELHTFLLGRAPSGMEWDHSNRNPLDNRRANLRAVPHLANVRNSGPRKNNTSGVRGVSWYINRNGKGRWVVSIRSGGRKQHIGYYGTIEAAAAARAAAEKRLWPCPTA